MAKRKFVTLEVTFDEFPFKDGEDPWSYAERVCRALGCESVASVAFHCPTTEVTAAGSKFRESVPTRMSAEIVAETAL